MVHARICPHGAFRESGESGFKHFLFLALLGEMIHFDEYMFQVGWFNHQLDKVGPQPVMNRV